jgi:hypothetical protein
MNGPAVEGTCGGVWTSPAVDTALGLVYASTANCSANPLPSYQEAIFALHIADGSPAWQWQPRAIDSLDMDFGATPNVFKLGTTDVVGAASKDGTYTLLNATSGAFRWSTKVALGGSFGGFYNATTDGTKIYLTSALGEAGADAATATDESFKGREYALDARTGNLVWRNYTGGISLGQNAAVNGVYFTGGLDHLLHAWDTSNGNLLTSLPLAGASSSGPAIAGGEVFIGAGTGATFRSAVGPCTPGGFIGSIPPGVCPPAPIPAGEVGQGIWGFCISTDLNCASAISVINENKAPTKVTYTGATSGDPNDPATLSANLTNTTGGQSVPLPNETVTFSLGSQTCSGTTDASGNANCTLTLNEAAGSYTVTAQFAGDAVNQPSSDSKAFTVNHEETTLAYTGDTILTKGTPAHLAAVLKDDSGTALQGRAVSFTLGSGTSAQTCNGTTDSSGTATCTIASVHQHAGSNTVTASFAGDQFFQPASTASPVNVVGRGGGGGGGGGCDGTEDGGDGHFDNGHGNNASFHADGDQCGTGDDPSDTPGEGNTVSEHDPGNGTPGSAHDFSSTQVRSISFGGALNTMTITGSGVDNGVPVTFIAQAVDNGLSAPGSFSLVLSDGYVTGGPLTSGTVSLG